MSDKTDKKRKFLLGYWNYTVILTYIGMLFGFTGILKSFSGKPNQAIACLMIAGFCDLFDGAIASTKKDRTTSEKMFGIQIDSLSDLICFCVLPAILVFSITPQSLPVQIMSGYFVLCGLIRLSFFNVDEAERQAQTTEPRRFFLGLPVTMSAVFLPMVYAIVILAPFLSEIFLSIALVIIGTLFLTPFELGKPRMLGKICLCLFGIVELILVAVAVMKVS